MGDSLSFAYLEKIDEMSEATVKVDLNLGGDRSRRVYGNITAVIKDESRVYSPVGSLLFTRTKKMGVRSFKSKLQLASSVVAVPSGWALDLIEVNLHIGTENGNVEEVNNLRSTLNLKNDRFRRLCYENGVEVNVTIIQDEKVYFGMDNQHFRSQTLPVEVKMMNKHPTIVYTIGDELSFIEFIMTLRRILADHPDREDLLDGCDLLNLSSTREHPVLAKKTPNQPARWLHVRLQVADDHGRTTSWTTLIMRDDTLYVLGFMNKDHVYGLVDNHHDGKGILPKIDYKPIWLHWNVAYSSILGLKKNVKQKLEAFAHTMESASLGRVFMEQAVRDLSQYALAKQAVDDDPARKALAGLIVMVCESARMNPFHDAFAAGWSSGKGFKSELMHRYVWDANRKYGKMSRELRTWKRREYAKPALRPQPIELLQTIHLMLNDTVPNDNGKSGNHGTGGGDGGSGSGGGTGGSNNEDGDGGGGGNGSSGGSGGNNGVIGYDGGGGIGGNNGVNGGGGGSSGGGRADECKGNGRALVELLSMRAKPLEVDTEIVVFDGKRGQIIYRQKEEQGQEETIDLELTGPYKIISAYGPFAIEIEFPGESPRAPPITWEWDCYDPKRMDEFDEPPKTEKIGDIAKVTYAVMSDALEATVQVKLGKLPDGHNLISVGGEITVLIDGFRESFLFKRRQEATLCLSPTDDKSWFILQLARNVIAVPYGKVLHIKVKLKITETSNKQVMKLFEANLTFGNGTPRRVNEHNDVEVDISWYPEIEMSNARPNHQLQQTSDEIGEQEVFTTPEPTHQAETEMATAQPTHQLEQTSEEIDVTEFTTAQKQTQLAETKIGTARSSHQPEQTSEEIHEHKYATVQEPCLQAENEMATAQPSNLPEQTIKVTSEKEFISTTSRGQEEDFVVKDSRNEGMSLKSYPPYLDKEVWRLEHIERGGDFHERLTQNNVMNVQDFLRMLAVKPDELRAIMGDGMNDSTWEEITRHARKCVVPYDKVYVYRAADADATIYVDSILDLVKVNFSGVEYSLMQLDQAQKELVQKITGEAYEYLDQLKEVQLRWKLHFPSQLRLPIHTGSRITDATGNLLEIIVVDAETGFPRPIPIELDIKLVPLQGDFPPYDDWSAEEFQTAIVKQRYEHVPLLKGDVDILMKVDGRVTVDVLQFTDDSSWVPSRKFRIGACVVPRASNDNGTGRILEAMTEAFVVRNRNRKHYPPELDDPVWRLEMIDKDGVVHRKLARKNVHTVKEFCRMLHVEYDKLRELIVGDGMTQRMWLMTIDHAKNCDAGPEVYKYSGMKGTIFVDSVFREVFKVEVHGVEYPLHVLDDAQMKLVRRLLQEAYWHGKGLQEVDVDMETELRDHEGIETSSLLGETFPGSDHRPVDRKRWMAELGPDRVRVHQVVWPGTHRPTDVGVRLSPVHEQLVTGARVIDVPVNQARNVCQGTADMMYDVKDVFDDVKRFLNDTESEVVVLEIRTEVGRNDPPEFDKFLVEQLGEYLIRQDDAVFNKTIAELLPQRVICVWKPRTSPAPKPGELLWSEGYLRDNWNNTIRSKNKLESHLKFLGQQPPVADRKFFYRVEYTWTPLDDAREYPRHFIAHVFAKGLDDKLQVFSTRFIKGDFVDACAGVTKARVEGAANCKHANQSMAR